jgi:hypothetical protein
MASPSGLSPPRICTHHSAPASPLLPLLPPLPLSLWSAAVWNLKTAAAMASSPHLGGSFADSQNDSPGVYQE